MDEEFDAKRVVKAVVVGFLVALVVILLFGSFGTVGAGERGVKTRMGAITGEVVQPGLYFKLPLFDSVHIIEVKTQTIAFETSRVEAKEEGARSSLGAASKDLQDVTVAAVVNYRIDPLAAQEIYQQYRDVDTYQRNVLEPIVQDSLKSVAPQYTAEELITKRAEFNAKASELIAARLSEKQALIENVNIVNIGFSDAFTVAIEAKVTAEQQALASKNRLEQAKYEAQQKIETAKGEAEKIRIESQALTEQPQYLEKKAIEQWNGVLPIYWGSGSPVPFINIGN